MIQVGDGVDEVLLAADGTLKMSRGGQVVLSGRNMPQANADDIARRRGDTLAAIGVSKAMKPRQRASRIH